jgi:hypothetical protein
MAVTAGLPTSFINWEVDVATEEEMRDPEWCWTCMRKCGSKPH